MTEEAATQFQEDILMYRSALREPTPHLFEPVEEIEIVHVESEVQDPGIFDEFLYIWDGHEGVAPGEGTEDVGSDEDLLDDLEVSADETSI